MLENQHVIYTSHITSILTWILSAILKHYSIKFPVPQIISLYQLVRMIFLLLVASL